MVVFTRRILRENWREHEIENSSRKVAVAGFMDAMTNLGLYIDYG